MGLWKEAVGGEDTTGTVNDFGNRHGVAGVLIGITGMAVGILVVTA